MLRPIMGRAGTAKHTGPVEIGFEAYGVRGSLRVSEPDLIDQAQALLPPGWSPCPPPSDRGRFVLSRLDEAYDVSVDDDSRIRTADLDVALAVLDAQIRAHVAFHAPRMIFVHAGVVGHEDGAILIPGSSFSGKTTLVAALVRAGATYYSDEFAVLDERGLVHPYPKPLSIRRDGARRAERPGVSPEGSVGTEQLTAALIVVTSYRPGGSWRPQRASPGAGALALFANTVPARDRPAEAMAAVRSAAASAIVLEGERGEAAETAAALLGNAAS